MRHDIPGFWKDGPHDPFPVEAAWRDFIRSIGGSVVEDLIQPPRQFENADFIFLEQGVVAELKEIETEFSTSQAFAKNFDELMNRLILENPEWRPELFGGSGESPPWFDKELYRSFRPPIQRILKKANKQLRETKLHYKIKKDKGILILVNDGFTLIDPMRVFSIACDILSNSFSSINALIYLTVNRYVEIAESDEPKTIWVTSYSDNADKELSFFIDDLGRKWFDFLESRIGPFNSRIETNDLYALSSVKSIFHPDLPTLKNQSRKIT